MAYLTKKLFFSLLVIVLLFKTIPVVYSQNQGANHFAQKIALFSQGLIHFQSQRFKSAGQNWLILAEDLAKSSKEEEALLAAYANVLATIAFESDDDVIAYSTWGTSIQQFLQNQTSWQEQRDLLANIIKQQSTDLRKATPQEDQLQLNTQISFLLSLEKSTGISQYSGPRPGLVSAENKQDDSITVSREYFARPLSLIDAQQTQGDEDVLSKYYDKPETDKEQADDNIIKRGFIRYEDQQTSEDSTTVSEDVELIETAINNEINEIAEGANQEPEKADDDITSNNNSTLLELNLLPDPYNVSFNETHLDIARTAWRYFKKNQQLNTGLYNSVNQYKRTTLWDLGSSLAGIVAAEQLGIINKLEFEERIGLMLSTLQQMPIYNSELPNREYATDSAKMISLSNTVSQRGSGWSALDIGRALIWLKIIANWYPDYKGDVNKIIQQWSFDRLSKNAVMNGTWNNGRKEKYYQEGRLGYEQYAASGFYAWEVYLPQAYDYEHTKPQNQFNVPILYDIRSESYLTSEPFFLSQMEISPINEEFRRLKDSIFWIHKQRWETDNILSAFSEDSISQRPWFLYNIIYDHTRDSWWNCISHTKQKVEKCSSISTKTAFAWSAIYNDDYTNTLLNKVKALTHPKYGYYSGVYNDDSINKSLTINTNAIILEAMLYIKRNGRPFLNLDFSNIQNEENKGVSRGVAIPSN